MTHEICGEQVMVSVDNSVFSGIARSNETAAFIIDCLSFNTTVDEITHNLCENYDVDEQTAKCDVQNIIEQLDSIGALEWSQTSKKN